VFVESIVVYLSLALLATAVMVGDLTTDKAPTLVAAAVYQRKPYNINAVLWEKDLIWAAQIGPLVAKRALSAAVATVKVLIMLVNFPVA
jgi:ribosomal protein L18